MTPEQFFAEFAHIADAPNGVQKLRELILQLAVRGKLVPQDPRDEPAAKLLERIQAEKTKLVKEKKIRKSDPLPPVTADDAPYEVPNGWEWVRLEDVVYLSSGTTLDKDKELETGDYLYVKVGDMNLPGNEHTITTSSRFANSSNQIENMLINGNSVIFPKRGGAIATNKKRIVNTPILVDLNTMAITCLDNSYFQYIYRWFLTINLWSLNNGTSVPQINNKDIAPLALSFPPLAEQHRIVAKVDQLMTLCDELETKQAKKQQKLTRLNNAAIDRLLTSREQAEFSEAWGLIRDNFDLIYTTPDTISKLRQAILQLAVQGKLVPQDPNDEPASALLAKIKAEKEQLLAKWKVKYRSSTALQAVKDMCFPIPSSWTWCNFSDVVFYQEGPGIRNWQFRPDGIKLLNVSNILPDGKLNFENSDKYISVEEYTEKYMHFTLTEGDLLFAGSGGSWGKCSWYESETYKIILNTSTIRMRFFSKSFAASYLSHFVNSDFFKKQMTIQLVGMQPNFGSTHLGRIYIPIPPLAEQHRIVAKVDRLMALCDKIESRITKSQIKAEKLATATVQGLLAA